MTSASSEHSCLQIAQTLSFALPAPLGPIAAAGIQALDILESTEPATDPNKALLDALTAQTKEIETFLSRMKLEELSKTDLPRMAGTVEETETKLKAAAQKDASEAQREVEYLLDKEINWLIETNNFVEKDLDTLRGTSFPSGPEAYDLGCTAVELYLNMLMSFICLLKLRCELRGRCIDLAASRPGAGVNPKLYEELGGELDTFESRLVTWTAGSQLDAFHNWCGAIKTARLALITAVQTKGEDAKTYFGGLQVATDYFEDNYLQDPPGKVVYSCDHTWIPVNQLPGYPPTEFQCISHKDDVEKHHDEYVAAVEKQMSIDFAYVESTIGAIVAQVRQLKDLAIPPVPAAPQVSWKKTVWNEAWASPSGTEVRYGLQLANQKGHSEVAWTSWVTSTEDSASCPLLIVPGVRIEGGGVPLADSAIILRELKAPGAEPKTTVRAALSATVAITEFIDLDPAPENADKVCPSALATPIVSGWQLTHATDTSGKLPPSWPAGARVRYQYRYGNDHGESVLLSPCAEPSGPAVAPLPGADGYLEPVGGGYLGELKIQRVPGATRCAVERQIGDRQETVSGPLETQGRFFLFKDEVM